MSLRPISPLRSCWKHASGMTNIRDPVVANVAMAPGSARMLEQAEGWIAGTSPAMPVAAGLESFRFAWKKTHRPELVEGRMSPPMPCFDGAQHWGCAADRDSSPVRKSLVVLPKLERL